MIEWKYSRASIMQGGGVEYIVKWEGFPEDDVSYEW